MSSDSTSKRCYSESVFTDLFTNHMTLIFRNNQMKHDLENFSKLAGYDHIAIATQLLNDKFESDEMAYQQMREHMPVVTEVVERVLSDPSLPLTTKGTVAMMEQWFSDFRTDSREIEFQTCAIEFIFTFVEAEQNSTKDVVEICEDFTAAVESANEIIAQLLIQKYQAIENRNHHWPDVSQLINPWVLACHGVDKGDSEWQITRHYAV